MQQPTQQTYSKHKNPLLSIKLLQVTAHSERYRQIKFKRYTISHMHAKISNNIDKLQGFMMQPNSQVNELHVF